MNRRLPTALVFFLALIVPTGPRAHGGGLDSSGCHHNDKLGGYHCYRGLLVGRSFASKEESPKALPQLQGKLEVQGGCFRYVAGPRNQLASDRQR